MRFLRTIGFAYDVDKLPEAPGETIPLSLRAISDLFEAWFGSRGSPLCELSVAKNVGFDCASSGTNGGCRRFAVFFLKSGDTF